MYSPTDPPQVDACISAASAAIVTYLQAPNDPTQTAVQKAAFVDLQTRYGPQSDAFYAFTYGLRWGIQADIAYEQRHNLTSLGFLGGANSGVGFGTRLAVVGCRVYDEAGYAYPPDTLVDQVDGVTASAPEFAFGGQLLDLPSPPSENNPTEVPSPTPSPTRNGPQDLACPAYDGSPATALAQGAQAILDSWRIGDFYSVDSCASAGPGLEPFFVGHPYQAGAVQCQDSGRTHADTGAEEWDCIDRTPSGAFILRISYGVGSGGDYVDDISFTSSSPVAGP